MRLRKPTSEEHLNFLYNQGIRALVRLEKGGFESQDIKNYGIADFQEYIPDFTAPSQIQIDKIVNFIKSHIARGEPVAVSCSAGEGRTGTILTAYLINEGYSLKDAELLMKRQGRKPYETREQKNALEEYVRRCFAIELSKGVSIE